MSYSPLKQDVFYADQQTKYGSSYIRLGVRILERVFPGYRFGQTPVDAKANPGYPDLVGYCSEKPDLYVELKRYDYGNGSGDRIGADQYRWMTGEDKAGTGKKSYVLFFLSTPDASNGSCFYSLESWVDFKERFYEQRHRTKLDFPRQFFKGNEVQEPQMEPWYEAYWKGDPKLPVGAIAAKSPGSDTVTKVPSDGYAWLTAPLDGQAPVASIRPEQARGVYPWPGCRGSK